MTAPIMKRMCEGCPYDYGAPATEMAYNYGCLPSVAEANALCQENDSAWACHSAPDAVCAGYAEDFPARVRRPLQRMEGVHSASPVE